MPEKRDPWTEEDVGDAEGGQGAEFVESDHNEPGSQHPPGQDAEDPDAQDQAGKG